jgi:flagellar basal body-associated protein FliL
MHDNTEATNSLLVAIVAIIAVFAMAYVGMMFFTQQASKDTDGTTAGIDLSVGTNGGDNPPPSAE